MVKNMLKFLTDEASKGYKKRKKRHRKIKIMDKYAQLNIFHHDHQLQVYMYAFMYVDPEKIQ